MPQYYYTAKSKKAEVTNLMSASDKKELARKLREEGLFLTKAEEVNKKDNSLFKRVSLADKIFLTRNLQMMLSGGLSLSRTLGILSLQTKNKTLKRALFDIREEVHKGKSFSEALGRHPHIFSKMFRSVIQLSEETGKIEENLGVLTKQMEKEHKLRSKVRGVLIYPAVIVVTMVAVGIVMMIFVVPRLTQTFEEMGVTLPFTTQIIVGFANLLVNGWHYLLIAVVLFVLLVRYLVKTKRGKKLIDFILLRTPIVSSVIKKNNSAYTARTLNSLLASGVSIVRGLEIILENIPNSYFKEAIEEAIEEVKKGENLSVALKPHAHLYSLLLIQMIEVGEETGQTSKVLSKTSDFLEEEVFTLTNNLASIIEPLLMVVIGVFVGFFALSMLLPMYSVLEVL